MTSACAEPPASDFTTDAEFACFFQMHTKEESELLTASILAHGVREPLVVWKEEKILLDGHSRLLICNAHGIRPPVVEYSFPDRDAARRWIVENALGRRNLTREQRDYVIGKRYLAEKQSHGGGRGARAQSEHLKTAERIAAETGVSRETVKRAAEYAEAVDQISKTCPKARAAILTGELKLTREQARRAAAAPVAPRNFAQIKRAAAEVARAKKRPLQSPAGTETKERLLEELDDTARGLASRIRMYVESGYPAEELRALAGFASAQSAIETLGATPATTAAGVRS